VWHALVEGLNPAVEYGYRMWKEPNLRPEVHRFDPGRVSLDPWTRLVTGCGTRCAVANDEFDWNIDQPLNTPLAESVIYELHVRGFTRDPSSGVTRPGTSGPRV
jgi:glycogen operon protein